MKEVSKGNSVVLVAESMNVILMVCLLGTKNKEARTNPRKQDMHCV